MFDLDGTLVDTLPVCYLAFRRALERVGAPSLTDAEIHALFGPSEEGMLQRVLPRDWEGALPAYFKDDAALITGKSIVTATMSVHHFGLADMFDAIEAGSPNGVVKAEAIGRLLARWQVKPSDAVYVGDGAADMHAAREAGVIAAGAAWAPGTSVEQLTTARADVIFTDASEFWAWLDARTREIRTR